MNGEWQWLEPTTIPYRAISQHDCEEVSAIIPDRRQPVVSTQNCESILWYFCNIDRAESAAPRVDDDIW